MTGRLVCNSFHIKRCYSLLTLSLDTTTLIFHRILKHIWDSLGKLMVASDIFNSRYYLLAFHLHLYFSTKMLKPLVTHWRASGIHIALYLDDGFIVVPAKSYDSVSHSKAAIEISNHVRIDLLWAGFIYNIKKSNWKPTHCTEWLGMIWDTEAGKLRVLDRRIRKIRDTISEIQQPEVPSIRKLHSFVSKIISLAPVCGNISRLMTRHCQIEIARASDEDNLIVLNAK